MSNLIWEISQTIDDPTEWRVEAFDEDGGCYVTLFAGTDAQRRAEEYLNLMDAIRRWDITND